MDAEHLIEVGAGTIYVGHVEVVDHDGEGKLAKVVPVQLNLLDAFAEFPDLGFLGIVEQHILRSRVVHVELADERTLGVMKMAALVLDDPAHLAGIFLFPLGHHVIVGFHFEQPFEDERKALGGRFLERQNLDVVIVHSQISAMAFDERFGEVIVEEHEIKRSIGRLVQHAARLIVHQLDELSQSRSREVAGRQTDFVIGSLDRGYRPADGARGFS